MEFRSPLKMFLDCARRVSQWLSLSLFLSAYLHSPRPIDSSLYIALILCIPSRSFVFLELFTIFVNIFPCLASNVCSDVYVLVSVLSLFHFIPSNASCEEYKKSLQNIYVLTLVVMATCFCHRMSLFSFSLYLHLYWTPYIAFAFRLWWVFRTCVNRSEFKIFRLGCRIPYTHDKKNFWWIIISVIIQRWRRWQ